MFLWLTAVVAVATFFFLIVFSEIVEESLASAHACFGISLSLAQEQLANFLFRIDLVLHELLEFEKVFVAIERDTFSFATVAAGSTCLLIIAFETLWHIIMNYITHIRFVDAHAECDGCHYHIDTFHEEVILILRTGVAVHTCMIRTARDIVGNQNLGKFLDFLAAQAIDDARFARMLLDIFNNVSIYIVCLMAHFIIEVRTVERRLESRSLLDSEIFHDIVLHLDSCRCSESNDRTLSNLVYYRTDISVFRTEIVPPFRDAMSLVDCKERHLDRTEELDVFRLVERLWRYIQKLSLARNNIGLDLVDSRLGE